jgi:hypothetical protein
MGYAQYVSSAHLHNRMAKDLSWGSDMVKDSYSATDEWWLWQ